MGKRLPLEAMEGMSKNELKRMQAELEALQAAEGRRVVILPPAPEAVELPPLKGKELKCVEYLVGMESRIVESGDALRERLRMVPIMSSHDTP